MALWFELLVVAPQMFHRVDVAPLKKRLGTPVLNEGVKQT